MNKPEHTITTYFYDYRNGFTLYSSNMMPWRKEGFPTIFFLILGKLTLQFRNNSCGWWLFVCCFCFFFEEVRRFLKTSFHSFSFPLHFFPNSHCFLISESHFASSLTSPISGAGEFSYVLRKI